ncbi:MAG: response regulator transcription factor [Firmicutes bacterium]|nr:response regulator transcription factor [Bacillota bacterium]
MRIVIVDDHPVVRNGVEQTLSAEKDMEVVGSAANCSEGLELIISEKPDIVIVDLRMPGGGGLELIRKARKEGVKCRFIILTSYVSYSDVSQAVAENVDGYILKEALPEELVAAVRLVNNGRRYYDPETIDSIVHKEDNDPFKKLTKREKEILYALTEGLSNKAIAEKFFITENTVKKHIGSLLNKLELQDRTQAALFAFSHGLGREEESL